MDYAECRHWLQRLCSGTPAEQKQAQRVFLDLQEEAVVPLVDALFAGVNETEAKAVIGLLADIGGPDAMAALRNLFYFEEARPALKTAAAYGLRYNLNSLSPAEVAEVEAFLQTR